MWSQTLPMTSKCTQLIRWTSIIKIITIIMIWQLLSSLLWSTLSFSPPSYVNPPNDFKMHPTDHHHHIAKLSRSWWSLMMRHDCHGFNFFHHNFWEHNISEMNIFKANFEFMRNWRFNFHISLQLLFSGLCVHPLLCVACNTEQVEILWNKCT